MDSSYSWYTKNSANSADSIHQILQYGSLEDMLKLKNSLGETNLKEDFLNHPKKVYSPKSLNFITKFILSDIPISNKDAYLTSSPRNTG